MPVAENQTPVLLLVDGHAYAYRSFYAIRNLNGPDGTPTNAIFGFVKTLIKMRERCEPTHLAVVWDGGLDESRTAELPGYKDTRDPMPDDLETQLDQIVEWLEASGIASICEDDREADDGIATLARQAEQSGFKTIIASADKDFFQLINSRIALLNPNDKTEKLWGETEVRAKTGVNPSQIVDWLSLVGDAVDDIPGVPGVGPKTAANLLNQFGSLNAILERLEEVKSDRIRGLLDEMRETLARNQRLVRLLEDIPLDRTPNDLQPSEENYESLQSLYTRWGFRGLLRDLEASRQVDLF